MQANPHYHVGLPQWNHPHWQQGPFAAAPGHSPLTGYASYFSSVEGNTTFYGLPSADNVARWAEQVPESFRFCFKLPQQVTHIQALRHGDQPMREFFDRLNPLQSRTGLLCIQLPASFGPDQLDTLAAFLQQLPQDWQYSVEVRHPAFFDKSEHERRFNRLLLEQRVNRTLFDTRALFAHPAEDPVTREAWQQKPRLPLHVIATGQRPMLRFISPLQWPLADAWLAPWLQKVADWIDQGRTPFLFFHTPDNAEAPELARYFVDKLAERRPDLIGPGEWPQPAQQQPSLF
ncbi:DUF72 domain-containing protein [Marinobacterium arenosum]|uniref:DUF72 domain-containing protein n=1 Tax=Marinobacterium arenosum TaxID=2862496 RepID=UPI001C951586|nr:DUF72 domain-containing protein [Marinobacterium arenosum]MBY4679006.1 DUF72 domain-containing protein [Marinobacterium arenosum]